MTDEPIDLVRSCYAIMRAGTDTEEINRQTEWLSEFLKDPESLNILIDIYNGYTVSTEKKYVIVSLGICVKNIKDQLSDDDRHQIFYLFLDLIQREEDRDNRNLILTILQKLKDNHMTGMLLEAISEYTNSDIPSQLEIAIMIAPLLERKDMELEVLDEFDSLTINLLDKGFSSDEFSLRLAALNYMLYSPKIDNHEFEAKLPFFWEQSLEIIKPSFDNNVNFNRVAQLFAYVVQDQRFPIDINPLLDICMDLFRSPSIDTNKMLALFQITDKMAESSPKEVLQSEHIQDLFSIYIEGAIQVFEPEDALAISGADLMDKALSNLCICEEALDLLYDLLIQLDNNDASLFVTIRALSQTFSKSKDFYSDKIEDIASILSVALQGDCLCLIEEAVAATELFMKYFGKADQGLKEELMELVLSCASVAPTPDIINGFRAIIDDVGSSEVIFEDAFVFLTEAMDAQEPLLQASAIMCLSSLVKYAPLSTQAHLSDIMDVLFGVLELTGDGAEILKSPAVDCIVAAANSVGNEFEPYLTEFTEYCIQNLSEESGEALPLSCFAALELIVENFPAALAGHYDAILPIAVDKATDDATNRYKQIILNHISDMETQQDISDIEIDDMFAYMFKGSEIGIRILSAMVKADPKQNGPYRPQVMRCIITQCSSISAGCRSAAAAAITNIAPVLAVLGDAETADAGMQMGNAILAIIPGEPDATYKEAVWSSIAEGFNAAAEVVDQVEYNALGYHIKELLMLTLKYASHILSSHDLSCRCEHVIYAIQRFLKMVAGSAGAMAPTMLCDFITFADSIFSPSEEEEEPSLEAVSFALSFESDLVASAASNLNNEYLNDLARFGLEYAHARNPNGFLLVRSICENATKIAEPYADDIFALAIEVFQEDVSPALPFLLMRDQVVGMFTALVMHVKSYEREEFIVPYLGALPLVVDFDYVDRVLSFFFQLYESSKDVYPEHFLRMIVVMFATPPSMFSQMGLFGQSIERLITIGRELLALFPNRDDLVRIYLNDDNSKIQYFNEAFSGALQ